MKISSIIFGLVFSLFITSCGGGDTHEQKHNESKTHHDHGDSESGLILNNGKKWSANKETTEGVQNMINLMDNFNDTDDPEAYSRLSENLQTQFKFIFTECTMTGEAHNQLHSFLLPMKKVFQDLSSGDIATCKSSFSTMKKHLGEYGQFFE